MQKPKILITGGGGQLAKSIVAIANGFEDFDFVFLSKGDLSLNNPVETEEVFNALRPQFCVNCAAYTAVDAAESNREQAFNVNATAVESLAGICALWNTKLIHISTDYVFNGRSNLPYKESDRVDPINVYGASKAKGEELALRVNPESVIVRTAWLYSEHGNNFVKTMMRLMNDKTQLNIVNDQIGSPTYAPDLARAIMTIIRSNRWIAGIYHYSNSGRISWYEFAEAIKELTGADCMLNPIPASQYPTPAKRPSYSLMDTTKIQKTFGVNVPSWKDSLALCIANLKK